MNDTILEYKVKATSNGFMLIWGDEILVASTPRAFASVLSEVNNAIYQGSSVDRKHSKPKEIEVEVKSGKTSLKK